MGGIALKKNNGFTLVELMIVVAIAGILFAIVLPGYKAYVLKSHRSTAISAIMDLASREARYYTTQNTYTSSLVTLGYASDPMPLSVSGGTTTYYNLSVQSSSASSFTLQAVPTGNQTSDTCGTYTYTSLGQKGISSGTLSDCWKQ
jgi:type IV pilus assembly protein PilE